MPATGDICSKPGTYRTACDCHMPCSVALGASFKNCIACDQPTEWIKVPLNELYRPIKNGRYIPGRHGFK